MRRKRNSAWHERFATAARWWASLRLGLLDSPLPEPQPFTVSPMSEKTFPLTRPHYEPLELSAKDLGVADTRVEVRTHFGGPWNGVTVVTLTRGDFDVEICPTRGMGVLDAVHGYGDFPLGWQSPVYGPVHPSQVDLQRRGGLGWLDGFTELVARCGLESFGPPDADAGLTLHGRIANLPASDVEVFVRDGVVGVRGLVWETTMFGPCLRLLAEITLLPDRPGFAIDDEIMNLGAGAQEFQLLYHINLGPPVLGKGSRLATTATSVRPINAHAASALDGWDRCEKPTPGFAEQVYCLEPLPDADNLVLLHDGETLHGALVSWHSGTLPYLTVWKNTAAEDDGYVTGIEPGTGYPTPQSNERAAGRVPTLAPGETRRFQVHFEALPNAAAVDASLKRIESRNVVTEKVSEPLT